MSSNLINQLLAPLIFFIFAAGFFGIWQYNKQWRSALFFSLTYLSCAMAFTIEAVPKDNIGPNYVAFNGDCFYTLSSVFFVFAIFQRMKNWAGSTIIVAVALLTTLGHAWFRFVDPDIFFRVRSITIGSGLLVSIAAVKILFHKKNSLDVMLICFTTLFALGLMCITFVGAESKVDLTTGSFANSVLLALINLLTTTSAMAIALTLFFDFAQSIYNKLQHQSVTDDLSGLLNRRGYEAGVVQQLNRVEGSGENCILMVFDIDRFKSINDTYGHSFGDEVIAAFGTLLSSKVRKGDLVGRIGGEEFCLFLVDVSKERVVTIAESIRGNFEKIRLQYQQSKIAMTISCGVASSKPGDEYCDLFRRADAALYRAKQEGRNKVVVA